MKRERFMNILERGIAVQKIGELKEFEWDLNHSLPENKQEIADLFAAIDKIMETQKDLLQKDLEEFSE